MLFVSNTRPLCSILSGRCSQVSVERLDARRRSSEIGRKQGLKVKEEEENFDLKRELEKALQGPQSSVESI